MNSQPADRSDPQPPSVPDFARLPAAHLAALAEVRDRTGLQAALEGEQVWVDLQGVSASTLGRLKPIPRIEFFLREQSGLLRKTGSRLAVDALPALQWQPLHELLSIELPPPRFASTVRGRSPLRLVRDDRPRASSAILTTLGVLADYVDGAPAIRLSPLRFAAAEDGRVLIVGQPVPPLEGEHYWVSGEIAVRSGWRLAPVCDPVVLQELVQLSAGDVALFRPVEAQAAEDVGQFTVRIVAASDFVPVTRGAVRATMKSFKQSPSTNSDLPPDRPAYA